MSQQTLAELSNNALYSATVVYALAMLAHIGDWAMARQRPEIEPDEKSRRPLAAALTDRARLFPGPHRLCRR